jgi:hypothetical protein
MAKFHQDVSHHYTNFSRYLNLSNKASWDYFPNNSSGKFINKLIHPICNDGDYYSLEIGIVELYYLPASRLSSDPPPKTSFVIVQSDAVNPLQHADGHLYPVLKTFHRPVHDGKEVQMRFHNLVDYIAIPRQLQLDRIGIQLLDEDYIPLPVDPNSTTRVVVHIRQRVV